MKQQPYELDGLRQGAVLRALREVCSHRQWRLLAAHVRTTHVHAVVEAAARPERVMNDFKAYASRALKQAVAEGPDRKRWARHGSTRYLWQREQVSAAVHYVVCEQGEPMAIFEHVLGYEAAAP